MAAWADRVRVLVGDCRAGLATLPPDSVHACVTSPPYWGLRDYGHAGQLGLEPSPDAYVAGMVDVFRAVRRVLRPDGTLWLNLGDSYAGANNTQTGDTRGGRAAIGLAEASTVKAAWTGLPSKQLLGIPWRVALALQADGWFLRCDVVWSKPNPMPESVTDRPTRAHEYLFLLSKSPSYFYDPAASLEQVADAGVVGGRNKRSVWTVATRPYAGAHFATMPPALVQPCVLLGTSAAGCCPACGAPWTRQLRRDPCDMPARYARGEPGAHRLAGAAASNASNVGAFTGPVRDHGFVPGCTCPPVPLVPCTVLDPFGGSGTTGAVALAAGRDAILCELNPAYVPLIHQRLAAAMRTPGAAGG